MVITCSSTVASTIFVPLLTKVTGARSGARLPAWRAAQHRSLSVTASPRHANRLGRLLAGQDRPGVRSLRCLSVPGPVVPDESDADQDNEGADAHVPGRGLAEEGHT